MEEQDAKAANEDNQQGAIWDYIRPVVNNNCSGIARPAIAANNFELKPRLIHMVQQNQFGGAPTEDPNAHLGSFLEICDTVKMNGVTEDAIRLRLFSFSLRDKAKAWFQSLPYGSITTWEGLAQKFLTKFFPPSKAARCPQHGYPDWLQIQTFYNGLNGQTRIVPSERSSAKKVAGLYEVDPITVLVAQMSSFTNQIAALTSHGSQKKSESTMAASTAYQKVERENEQLQYVNDRNFNQKENYSRNNYYQGFNNQEFERKPSLEDILGTFISETRSRFNKDEARLDSIETHMTNLGTTVKNLEVQIEINPREHYNAITLRSGKPVEERKLREVGVPTSDPILAREKQTEGQKTDAERYLKKEFDEKFVKFLEVFKKIHINIPFAETLAQMPNYAKFLKEVMSKKRQLEEFETVKLTEEYPGNFNIPCNIGGITFDSALCDLGASIKLMPLLVFKKLGLEKVNPTTLTLQLADKSITYPKGIIEEVLVKVDKFIFPVDFVVLDMEEAEKVSLILGQPFLATGRALIDAQEGKLTLRVNEEEVTFNIHQEKKAPEKGKVDTCKMIQSVEVIAGTEKKGNYFMIQMKKAVDFILAQEANPPDKKKSYVDRLLKPPNITKPKEVLKAIPGSKQPKFDHHLTMKEKCAT
ncbi:uncharacterized protein LOC111382049 [Olea europaea var. sylvestris]|uniref:uncharacterized protein LOC111382049 n=1 Tax=Olea europaea var. sylvestris TaxID=158386 RepID=UPI000C1CCF09|nr:uncharacterized protein LOC111382049 [Olea europaea var. sylvestris]